MMDEKHLYFVSYSYGDTSKFGFGNCYIWAAGRPMNMKAFQSFRGEIMKLTGQKNVVPLFAVLVEDV